MNPLDLFEIIGYGNIKKTIFICTNKTGKFSESNGMKLPQIKNPDKYIDLYVVDFGDTAGWDLLQMKLQNYWKAKNSKM